MISRIRNDIIKTIAYRDFGINKGRNFIYLHNNTDFRVCLYMGTEICCKRKYAHDLEHYIMRISLILNTMDFFLWNPEHRGQ